MNKKLKSIIGLIMAAMMVLSLAACAGGKSSDAKKDKEDETAAAQEIAEAFLDDYTDFNFKGAVDYLDSGEFDKKIADMESKDDLVEIAKQGAGSALEEVKDAGVDIDGFFEDLVDLFELDYEIKSAKLNKDKAVEVKFELTLTSPDEEIMNKKFNSNSSDIESRLREAGVNESSTDAELNKAMGSVMQDLFDEAIDEMKDALKEETKDGVLVLEKKKGEWVINEKDSKIDGKSISKIAKDIVEE